MNTLILISLISFLVGIVFDKVSHINKRLKRTEYKVEYLLKHLNLPELPINEELRQLVKDKENIKAIKKAKAELGLSLKEAKEYVDSL
jgi:ribosomal protein L7/L12